MSRVIEKKFIEVNNHKMAYAEIGQGDPIVFIHGNPSSSHEWRSVMPTLSALGRCIAVDLIGMGDSDKLDPAHVNAYSFETHQHYLASFLKALNLDSRVTLVLHDWGSALGFDWAYHHQDALKAIAYMESFVAPIASWDDLPQEAIPLFNLLRGPAGEKMVLEENFFIEQVLPAGILRQLTREEMDEYRRPFIEPGETRRPMLQFFRSVPIAGEPKHVHDVIVNYQSWLKMTPIPKLFIEAMPGDMFPSHREIAKSFPNQKHVQIQGGHFVQEDSPDQVASEISSWYQHINNS